MANTYDSMKKQLQDEAYRKMLNEFMNSGAMANSSLAQQIWAQQSPAAAYTAHGYDQRKAQGGGVTQQEIETLTSPSFYTPESYGEFNKEQVRQAIIDQTAFINTHRNEGVWDTETNDPSWWSDKYLAEQLAGYDDQIWREKTIEELINASTGYGWKYSNMTWDELLDEMMGDEELASPYVEDWLRAYNLSVPADSRMTMEQLQAISDPVARTAVYNDLQRRFAGNIDALLESGMYRVTEPGQATASESLTFRKERAQKEQANRQTAAEYQAKLADPQYRNTMAMATASGQVEVDGKTYPNLWLWATNTGNSELLVEYEDRGYGFLTPDELVMYQQLYEINPADAMGYLDSLSRVLNVRRKALRDAEKSLKATDGFWNGIISWAEALGTPIENILTGDILRQTYHAWKGDADPNAFYFDTQNDQVAIRGSQNAEIKGKFGSTAAFFYDAFNSIADVGLTTGLDIALGGTGLVNAGLNATKAYSGGLQSNAARDIQGLWSVGQALGDAGIEALFEKLGFDGSTKSANRIWGFLRNAFGEGAEEVFTNMGTTAFDAVMSAAQGRDNMLVEMYKAYTLAGAENPGMQVALDKVAELGMDATMGTIAGGTLGGVHSAANALSTRNLGRNIAPTVNEDALLEIARAMPEGSESRRLAQKYFPQALTGDTATETTTESKEPAAKGKKPGKLETPVELTGEDVPDAEPEKAEGKTKKPGKIEKPVELTGVAVPEPETEAAKAKAKKPSLEGKEVALDGEVVPDKETPVKKAEKPGKLEKPVELTGEAAPDAETAESTRTKEKKKAEKPAAPKKGKLSFYQLGRLTQALEVDLREEQSRVTNDVMDQAIANRLMELGDDAATARKNATAIRKLYRGQEVTLTERSGLAWNENASQVTKELASTIKEGEEGRVGNSWRAAMGAVAEKATVQVRDMQTQLREALTNKKSILNGAISTAKSKAAKVARGNKNVTSKMVTISDGENGTESKGEFRRFKKHGGIMEMVVFSDGAEKTVSVDDMTEAEGSGMAEIIEYVADGGTHDMSEAEANTLAQVYQSVGGDADSVIRSYEMVYLSGYTGMEMPANVLPDAAAKAVYDSAKAEAVADEKTRVDRAKAVRRTTKGLVTFLGKVSKDNEVRGAGSEVALSEAMEGMTDSQQQTVEAVRAFAHKFQINMVLFESTDEGVSTMQNGSYDPNTHTVYVDINSGANSKEEVERHKKHGTLGYAMMRTLGHEVTHAIESTSAEGYAAYKAAVKEKLGRQWNGLVQEKLVNALNVGRKLTLQGAEAEVVADASEYMLQDTKFVYEIDKTVRGKVKAVIADFVEKVRSIFVGFGVKGANRESQTLRRIQGNVYHYLDNLQQLWDVAAEEMVSKSEETIFDETESYDVPLTEETASEGKVLPELPTQHSNRDAQTSTPQFQRWFGESKVVDASGQPKVMYHGTRTDKDFTVFDTWGSNFGLFGVGSYFTDDKMVAEGYTRKGKGSNPRVYEVYLSIENPLDMDAAYDPAIWQTDDQYLNRMFEGSQTNEDAFRRLKEYCEDEDMERGEAEEFITDFIVSKGFDGIRHTGGGRYSKGDTNRHEVYIAFEPEQIKSATGNVGTFDRENPDIRYSARSNAVKTAEEMETTDGQRMFSLRSFTEDYGTYRSMLLTHGSSVEEVDALFHTIDEVMKDVEANREILDFGWNVGREDRSFSPVKPNSDPLYEVSMDFSTLCRKRLLQQAVQERLESMYDTVLTKAERVAIRNELMKLREAGKQIEVACALCYVESTRLKSPAQIQRFFDDRRAVMVDYFAKKNKAYMKSVDEKADELIVKFGYEPGTAKKNLKTKFQKDSVTNLKQSMYKKYEPTAEEEAIIETALSLPGEAYKTDVGLWNLKKEHPVIFDAYTSHVRNATKSKGIEGDEAWWAGDSQSISDSLIAKMNAENGLRTQSWSDFQVIHLLDYISAIIELSTRGAKMQSYTKVPDFVNLMGDTGVMINLSLIPKGFDGTLNYDPIEGMPIETALALREMFPNTAGTICIGITTEHIRMLLADPNTDYVIPYHSSSLDKKTRQQMGMKVWQDFQKYQNEKEQEYSNTVKGTNTYHKKPTFSEWFDYETVSARASEVGAERAMQEAADRYIDLCHRRGLQEKFAQFSSEPNYWKLLIDRKMINQQTGEIIRQEAVKPRFDLDRIRAILKDEVSRFKSQNQDFNDAVAHIERSWANGDIRKAAKSKKVKDAVSAFEDTVTVANIVASAQELDSQGNVQHSTRDSAPGMTAREFISDSDDSIAATVEERNALGIYKSLLLKHADASDKVIAAEQVLAVADDADMPEARKALSAARAQQRELYNRLLNVERTEHVQNVINRTNDLIGKLYGKTAEQAEKITSELEREIESLRLDLQALKVSARTQREADIREKERLVRQLNSKAAQALLAANERHAQNLSNLRTRNELNLEIGKQARHIKRIVKRLNDRIIHEEDYKNVKEPMKPAVRTLVRTFIDGFGGMVFNQNTASHLRIVYDELAREGDDGAPEFYSDDVSNWLADLAMLAEEDAERRAAGGSGMQAVEQKLAIYTRVAEIADHIYKIVNGADELFVSGKRESFAAMSANVAQGLYNRKDRPLVASGIAKTLKLMDNLIRTGNMTPTFFFENLQNAGIQDLFDSIMAGQTGYAKDILSGDEFIAEMQKRYRYLTWQNMKNPVEIKTEQGHHIWLTTEQMMWVHATAKREETNRLMDTHHLDVGGFKYDSDAIPRKKRSLEKVDGALDAHRLSAKDVANIRALLTPDQIAYADGLVEFLSTTCAEWGNAASMEMFGIRKYNEEYYFPFQVSPDSLYQKSNAGSVSTTDDARMRHASFTHSIRRGASETLVLGNLTDVVNDHINRMATYANFVVPIESMNRVLNAKVSAKADGSGEAVRIRSLIERKYGQNAQKYIADLLKDLNGGPQTDNRGTFDAGLRLFKKNAVAGKLSVSLQQPMAIARAFAYVNPLWFANIKWEFPKTTWERMMKHSGTAVLKDMGGFNVGYGKNATNWLGRGALGEYWVFKRGKFLLDQKGFLAMKDEWVDFLTGLPGWMDKVTWISIWNAVENEQSHQHPDMDRNSDEFLDMVGRRFDDVINHTQVYDSILSKSQNMRSKNMAAKMATSFMAESTLNMNLAYSALSGWRSHKHGVGKRAGILSSLALNAALTAAAYALIGAFNRDDDERTFEEKWVVAFAGRLADNINPLASIPYLTDLWNKINGYDVERTDISFVLDMVEYGGEFFGKLANPDKNGRVGYRDYENFVGNTLATLTGAPVKNWMGDARRIWNAFHTSTENAPSSRVWYGILDEIYPWRDSTNTAYYERYLAALTDGDKQEMFDLKDFMLNTRKVKEDTFTTGVRNAYKDAYLRSDGKITKDQAVNFLFDNGLVDGEDADKKKQKAFQYVDKWDEGTDGYSAYNTLSDAFAVGNSFKIQSAINELSKYGYSEEQITQGARNALKELVKAKKISTSQATALLRKYASYKKDNDNVKKPQEWLNDKD